MTQKSILIVDDDPDVHALYGAHLRHAGYRTVSATDGISCMAAVKRERPDLVVLDLGLPAGDGETALRALRRMAHLAQVPILIASGREEADWAERLEVFGANGYLQKPVDPSQLVERVRQLLGDSPVPPLPDGPAGVALPPTDLSCPHCGHGVSTLHANLTPEAIQAVVNAVRARS